MDTGSESERGRQAGREGGRGEGRKGERERGRKAGWKNKDGT